MVHVLLTDWLVLLVVAAAALYIYGGRALTGWRVERKLAGRRRHGGAAELLRDQGYRIVDVNRRLSIRTLVDGRPHDGQVQADFIVARGFRRYVARVRPAQEGGARVTNRETRRQLLEYVLAFGSDGVILVDTGRGRLRQVEFDTGTPRWLRWLAAPAAHAAAAMLGAALVYLMFRTGVLLQ